MPVTQMRNAILIHRISNAEKQYLVRTCRGSRQEEKHVFMVGSQVLQSFSRQLVDMLKTKATNKQTHKLIDADNSVVVTRGEERGGDGRG